jgi:hypothetical protein
MPVDEPRGDDAFCTIDDFGISFEREIGTNRFDNVVFDEDVVVLLIAE